MTTEILLGDEAVARGAIDAGISAAYAYPGTPSTEIFETDPALREAATRRRAACGRPTRRSRYEEALGVSYAGKRALVAMKHVGLNVAADPFMNAAVVGAHGGLVLAVADDPVMHSSQNEQDSRYFADFAQVPCLEPAEPAGGLRHDARGLRAVRALRVPVLLRLVTRLAHSRARVDLGAPRAQNEAHYVAGPEPLHPHPVQRPARVREAPRQAAGDGQRTPRRTRPMRSHCGEGKPGIIVASGVAWNYLQETLGERARRATTCCASACYPLPVGKLRALLDASTAAGRRRGGLPVHRALRQRAGPAARAADQGQADRAPAAQRRADAGHAATRVRLAGRPRPSRGRRPRGRAGRASAAAVRRLSARRRVHRDQRGDRGDGRRHARDGRHRLLRARLPQPYQAIHSCVCMGASIGMAIGAAHAGIVRRSA